MRTLRRTDEEGKPVRPQCARQDDHQEPDGQHEGEEDNSCTNSSEPKCRSRLGYTLLIPARHAIIATRPEGYEMEVVSEAEKTPARAQRTRAPQPRRGLTRPTCLAHAGGNSGME